LVAAQAPLHAQDAQPTTNETGTVGPRELEDFSINGTVTQPAPQRPSAAPTTRPASPPTATRPAPAPTDRPAQTSQSETPPAPTESADAAPNDRPTERETEPLRQTAPSSSVTAALPGLDSQAEAPASAIEEAADPSTESGEGLLLWPWLVAALAAAAGLGLYLYRGRLQLAFAGGPEAEAFEPPVPAPAPPPRKVVPRHDPTPRSTPAPVPEPVADPFKGLVSTRLRPWIELGFQASRCTIENDKVTIDFEIEMINSGNAPARAVLVEARLVNAGPSQDSEIGQFFSNPVGQGERIDAIAPLKNVRIKSRIVTPLENVQVLNVAGRKVFVPLIAFNILYGWARGTGQTSASYLVGRDTKSDKMAPFRLDLGPRLFRSLGQTPLPIAVRQ
jgi:hypothetical protein